jgi:hypothetical protein
MRARSALFACVFATAAAAQQQPAAAASIVCEGRILDVLGDAVPVAEVGAIANQRSIARTFADADGVYRIRVPASGADLVVRAKGKVAGRLAWHGAPTQLIRNLVLEDGADLRGRVFDADGAPVARAIVIAAAPGCSSQTTITDDNGAYELRDLPLRPLIVRALTDDAVAEATLRLAADTVRDLTLASERASCRVRVRGLSADAATGITVRVFGADLAAVQNGGRLQLDAAGVALLHAHGDCLVDVLHPDLALEPPVRFVSSRARVVEFAVAGPAAPPTTRLVQGNVRAIGSGDLVGLRLVMRDRSQQEIASAIVGHGGEFHMQVVLPADGFCRVGLALGPWLLLDDDKTIADGFCWVPAGDTRNRLQLMVDRAGMLQSFVRGAGGGFALADVVVVDSTNPHRELVRACADGAGAITLGLPAGDHELLAVAQDGSVSRAALRVHAGGKNEPQWLPIEVGEVAGVLRDATGAPVPGVDLLVASKALQEPGEANASVRQRCEVVTDRNGRFRARGLPVGDWTVAAIHDARVVGAAFDVRANQRADIALSYGP